MIFSIGLRPMEGATDVNDRLVPRGEAKRTNISGGLTTGFSSKVDIIFPIL